MKERRRKKLLGTPLQKKLLFLIFASAVIPATIVAVCLYYLIFNLLANQLGIPESIAYNLIPVARRVNLVILISMPIALLIIWIAALRISHRIVGPLYRLEKELDAALSGKEHEPIKLRGKDEKVLHSLVEKINRIIKERA